MGNCFLVGSERDEKHEHRLKVLHYIEYLTFDLENLIVKICADFFVKNVSRRATPLYGLHCGNIKFRSDTSEWFKDTEWTPVLLELAREEIGLIRKNDDELYLCEIGGHTDRVHLLCEQLQTWGPEPPADGRYVCFTAWESPPIESGECGLFRVAGSIVGETYNRLLPDPHSDEPIKIVGGVPLVLEIQKNLTPDYEPYYKTFVNEYTDDPAFYHVFFERTGGQSLKTIMVSTDITKVCVNKEIKGGRFINWYWSDTEFNVYTKANGPVLEMIAY